MAERANNDDLDLLDELGVDTTPATTGGRTAREQRVIAGFEEITRYFQEHGRAPGNLPDADIFERIYAVRLDAIRRSPECREILRGMETHGLLEIDWGPALVREDSENKDTQLLDALGVDSEAGAEDEISRLTHVRSREEIRAAEEIAQRTRCEDFEVFRPIFQAIQRDLENGARNTVKFQENAEVNEGEMFILDGQKVFVAGVGEKFINDYGRPDRRLRLIYDNGTESDLLLRSFQRALYKDKASRRISTPDLGPLFAGHQDDDDCPSGFIYILRSLSENPFIQQNREVIHKIGVTGGDIKRRVANARKDPTFLMAEVEIIETYRLANVDRSGVERLLHRFFAAARLDLHLKDRFGEGIEPREWFLVPLPIIREVIGKLLDGSIQDYRYDPANARIVKSTTQQD